MVKYEELLSLLKGHTVWIQMHNFPDPDAVESAYGLQFFLKKNGIDATICYDGHVDKISVIKMFECFGVEAVEYHELDISEELIYSELKKITAQSKRNEEKKQEVKDNTPTDDKQIPGIEVPLKPQRHPDQKHLRRFVIKFCQQVVSHQHCW